MEIRRSVPKLSVGYENGKWGKGKKSQYEGENYSVSSSLNSTRWNQKIVRSAWKIVCHHNRPIGLPAQLRDKVE